MTRNFLNDDYVPLKKEVRRLSKANADSTERVLEDLNDYLTAPNPHRYPDGLFYADMAAWTPAGYDYDYISDGFDAGTYAGYYIENGRIYFEGAIQYVDGYTPPGYPGTYIPEADRIFGLDGGDPTFFPNRAGQALPEEARPISGFHTKLFFDSENSSWGYPGNLAMYRTSGADASERVAGASVDIFVSNTGYVYVEGVANRDGRAKRVDGSLIGGVPTGSTLNLNGLSWKVADPD